MSDPHTSSSQQSSSDSHEHSRDRVSRGPDSTGLELLDQCLQSLPEGDARIPLLYQLRQRVVEMMASSQQSEAERTKMQTVIEKLTAPACRIGTMLAQSEQGTVKVMVGGAEYVANVDPRIEGHTLNVGHQVLVNEAYVVIRSLGYDLNGPVVKVREVLDEGRLRLDQEAGRQGMIIHRADNLKDLDLKVGDEVRLDPTHRLAIERLESSTEKTHLLADLPHVRWEDIGGQEEAIGAIRRAIEYPLLHEDVFHRFQFQQPKGFLLYGPPGCGKTLIGQATAASLGHLLAGQETMSVNPRKKHR